MAFALGTLGALTLGLTPAQAHTADIKAVAKCETDGTYTVTFTLTLGNVPAGATALVEARTGTTSFQGGWNRNSFDDWETISSDVPSTQSTVSWTRSLPGTTTGNGPWEYAVTSWTSGTVIKSDTRAEGLDGDCTPPPTSVTPSVQFTPGDCLNDGSVVLSKSPDYTWAEDGPVTAKVYTASPVGNVVLTQSVFGPYDLSPKLAGDPDCVEPEDPFTTILGTPQTCVNPGTPTGTLVGGTLAYTFTNGSEPREGLVFTYNLLDLPPVDLAPLEEYEINLSGLAPGDYVIEVSGGELTEFDSDFLEQKAEVLAFDAPCKVVDEEPELAATGPAEYLGAMGGIAAALLLGGIPLVLRRRSVV